VVDAVIGSVGHCDETVFPLIEQLLDEGIWVTLIDNRGTFPTDELDDRVFYFEMPQNNIHQVWNRGMDVALEHGADWCCILNDDITLAVGAPALAAKVCVDEDIWIAGFDYEGHEDVKLREAGGSYRDHGVGGFAYMIRPGVGLRYDERFNWWGGDDDLVWTCLQRGGRAVVVEGANVQHPDGGNTTGQHYPELMAGVSEDWQLLMDKWGKGW
jgi:hypothetical protein